MGMSSSRLRFLDERLSSSRKTGALIGVSHQTIVEWRRGKVDLTQEQLAKVETYLFRIIDEINRVAVLTSEQRSTIIEVCTKNEGVGTAIPTPGNLKARSDNEVSQ
jgi:hypothetical protein